MGLQSENEENINYNEDNIIMSRKTTDQDNTMDNWKEKTGTRGNMLPPKFTSAEEIASPFYIISSRCVGMRRVWVKEEPWN